MYNTYYLVTFMRNIEGGASSTTESMTKEVEGQIVPCTEAEAKIKMAHKLDTVGGNPSTQSIKCILFNADGNAIKVDEIIKDIVEAELV